MFGTKEINQYLTNSKAKNLIIFHLKYQCYCYFSIKAAIAGAIKIFYFDEAETIIQDSKFSKQSSIRAACNERADSLLKSFEANWETLYAIVSAVANVSPVSNVFLAEKKVISSRVPSATSCLRFIWAETPSFFRRLAINFF